MSPAHARRKDAIRNTIEARDQNPSISRAVRTDVGDATAESRQPPIARDAVDETIEIPGHTLAGSPPGHLRRPSRERQEPSPATPTPHEFPSLLTPNDVSGCLGVPVGTLANWRYRGHGPAFVRVGKHVRYRVEDVAAWVENQIVDHRSMVVRPVADRRRRAAGG